MKEEGNATLQKVNEEVVEPLKNALVSRFSNPLVWSVALTWLILNWDRVFILLFSKISMVSRIGLAKSLPSELFGITYALTLYLPVLIGVLWVFVSPRLTLYVRKKNYKSTKLIIDNDVDSKYEAIRYEAEVLKGIAQDRFLKKKSDSGVELLIEEEKNKNERITELLGQIKSLESQLEDTRSMLQSARGELSSLNVNINDRKELLSKLDEESMSHAGMEGYHLGREAAMKEDPEAFK